MPVVSSTLLMKVHSSRGKKEIIAFNEAFEIKQRLTPLRSFQLRPNNTIMLTFFSLFARNSNACEQFYKLRYKFTHMILSAVNPC